MKKRVLIIEDDRSFAKVISFLIEGEGLKVSIASNGKDALETISRKPPDLIILDLNMPDIDGFKLCAAVKARQDTQDIPIIILSARDKIASIKKGLALGAVEYFVKPVDNIQILEAVRKHLC